jgi:hypothetical protein
MKWEGHVAHVGVIGNACTIFVSKYEEKRSLERYWSRWKDNI